MNADRLKQTVELLLESEKTHNIQNQITQLSTAVNNLVSQPQNGGFQTNTANALASLESATTALFDQFTPAQVESIKALGAYPYFSTAMAAELRQLLAQASITPAVLQTRINQLTNERNKFMETLRQTVANLNALNVAPTPLEDGQTEMGVSIPGSLYDNDFGRFIKTGNQLDLLIRLFSEAATGTTQPVSVRQIASSDPTFFLGMDAKTAVAIGATITWLLNTLKQLLEIRKLRNESAKVGLKDDELAVFDSHINKVIESSIDQRVEQILEGRKGHSRENLSVGLKSACQTLMAWIERGVTIEVRTKPPKSAGDKKADPEISKTYSELQSISQQLAFPPVDGPPIIQLPKDQSPPQGSSSLSTRR